MHRTRYRSHRPLQSSLIALALNAAVCVLSTAPAAAEHWRPHDSLTISGAPAASVTAGQAYTFTPGASDSLGRALQFHILNMPSWATFSPSSGQLSGTPSAANAGTYGNITISVSDGLKHVALPAFNIQVLAAGTPAPPPTPPPSISGSPAPSDVAGSAYAFQPSASGPSGMTLSFSVQNKPSWANFSIASGLLSGTPASSQTGTYTNIVISVSDGQAASALPAFSVTVTAPVSSPPASGSATMTLTPPTQNTDGSTLTDLAGMTVYYGTAPTSLNQSVQLAATPTSYTIGNLGSGTWYFGAIAYTTDGTQSAMTPVMSKSIP